MTRPAPEMDDDGTQHLSYRGEPCDLPEKARTLKARVNPIHKLFANDADLQLVANYKKTQIKKYNNVFELIRVFEPEGERDKPPCIT